MKIHPTTVKSLLMLWIVAIMACDNPSEPESPVIYERLQAALDSALVASDPRATGVSAAVFVPGYDVWLGVSGMSDPANSEEMTSDLFFNIGGNRFLYQTALILKYEELGLLDIDDPISDYLPPYEHVDGNITIRQLLGHTSGLFDSATHPDLPLRYFPNIDNYHVWTPEAMITTFMDDPVFAPGTDCLYSSANATLMEMIVETISQSNTALELRGRFFTPLELTGTFIDHFEPVPANARIAHGWFDYTGDGVLDDIHEIPRTARSTSTSPAVYCTAEDFLLWTRAVFEAQIVDQTSLDKMLEFRLLDPQTDAETHYGLGIWRYELLGIEIWGHWGWDFGFNTFTGYLPDHEAYIVVLCNFNGPGVSTIFPALMDVVLEYSP